MANKIKYGLKNVHYAVITEAGGVVSYAAPVPIPGAVNIDLSPVGEKVEFYADDLLYYGTNANQGYEGSLEIALIPDSFRRDVMSEVVDANQAQVENAEASPKNFALLFQFNGDANAVRHVLYNVNAARPSIKGATKTKNIEPQTETLQITASPALDTYNVKTSLPSTAGAAYNGFFEAVYLEDAVLNTKGADPANFSKGAPTDVEVTSTSNGDTAIKNVLLNGLPVPGVSLTIAVLKATIASAYVAGLSLVNGDYPLVVEFTKGNSVVYTLKVGD